MSKLTKDERKFLKKFRRDPESIRKEYESAMIKLNALENEMRKDPSIAIKLDALMARIKER